MHKCLFAELQDGDLFIYKNLLCTKKTNSEDVKHRNSISSKGKTLYFGDDTEVFFVSKM